MELDRTAAPPGRFMKRELMIFLKETQQRCRKHEPNMPKSHVLRRYSLLRVVQEAHGVDGGGVLPGVVEPAAGVVLHPVCAVTVAQQEMVRLFALQEESVTWCKFRRMHEVLWIGLGAHSKCDDEMSTRLLGRDGIINFTAAKRISTF